MSSSVYSAGGPAPDPPLEGPAKARLFQGPVYRDGWAAALFLLQLVAVVSAAGYAVGSGRAFDGSTWFAWARDDNASGPTEFELGGEAGSQCTAWHRPQTAAALGLAGGAAVAGMGLGIGWLALAASRPLGFLRALLAGYIALIAALFAAQLLAFGFSLPSLLLLLLIPLYAMWWRVLWRRAEFSAAILGKASRTVLGHKGTVLVAVVMTAVSIAYDVAWVLALNVTTAQWQVYPLVLALLWSALVFANITHTTVCGVAATDFFLPEGTSRPVWGALRRTCTFSLGSVCLGSAAVAIVQFLRLILRQARPRRPSEERRNGALLLVACCLEFLLQCLEQLLRWFNRYAFVHVAMYGKPFVVAARDTWALVQRSGIDALLNDMIVDTALGMCTALSALAAGGTAALVAHMAGRHWWANCDDYADAAVPFTALAGVGAVVLVAFLHNVMFTVLDSAIVTFFVCFAEEPEVLALKHPNLDLDITRRIHDLRNG